MIIFHIKIVKEIIIKYGYNIILWMKLIIFNYIT